MKNKGFKNRLTAINGSGEGVTSNKKYMQKKYRLPDVASHRFGEARRSQSSANHYQIIKFPINTSYQLQSHLKKDNLKS